MLVLHLKRVCDLSMFISFLIIFYAKILGPFISRGDRWRGIRLVVATGVAIPPQCHYCKRQHAIQKEILHFSVIMMIQKRKSLQLILNGNSERRKSKLIRGNSNVHGQVLDNVYIVHCMRSKMWLAREWQSQASLSVGQRQTIILLLVCTRYHQALAPDT